MYPALFQASWHLIINDSNLLKESCAAARRCAPISENLCMHVNQVGYDCGFSGSQYGATLFRMQFGAILADYA